MLSSFSFAKYWQIPYIIIAITTSAISLRAQSPTTKSTTSVVNINTTGSTAWSNTNNATSSNNSYASSSIHLSVLATAQTSRLFATGFGFAIPADATIKGIEARVERHATGLLRGSYVSDYVVMLLKSGAVIGANYAHQTEDEDWTGSDVVAVYGNNTDLWGTTWTPAEVNNVNFGLAISAFMRAGTQPVILTANVDHISITIYYTVSTLPVRVTHFSVTKQVNAAKVNWTTSSEQNNSRFEIYRSSDNKDYKTLTTIAAKNTASAYTYLDKSPFDGVNYYKIINVDNDGSKTEVGLKALSFELNAIGIFTGFNPVTQQVNTTFPEGTTQLEVFDIAGKLLKRFQISPMQKGETFSIAELPVSIYNLKVKGTWGSAAKKLVKF